MLLVGLLDEKSFYTTDTEETKYNLKYKNGHKTVVQFKGYHPKYYIISEPIFWQ